MKNRAILTSLLLLVLTTGCGENSFEGQEDKETSEAQAFDRSANLDSGNWEAVLNDPNATAIDYAAAAMGLAGLDPVNLIQAMNDASAAGTTNDLGSVAGLALDPNALDELQTAKDNLAAALAANPTDPDLNFQMVLVSLTSTMTALAQVGEAKIGGFNAADGISTTDSSNLGTYIAGDPTVQVDTNGDGTPDTQLVTLISADVNNVSTYLPNANLAGSDLNNVLTAATQGPESINYDDTGTVSPTDISNYLNLVLGI